MIHSSVRRYSCSMHAWSLRDVHGPAVYAADDDGNGDADDDEMDNNYTATAVAAAFLFGILQASFIVIL